MPLNEDMDQVADVVSILDSAGYDVKEVKSWSNSIQVKIDREDDEDE